MYLIESQLFGRIMRRTICFVELGRMTKKISELETKFEKWIYLMGMPQPVLQNIKAESLLIYQLVDNSPYMIERFFDVYGLLRHPAGVPKRFPFLYGNIDSCRIILLSASENDFCLYGI